MTADADLASGARILEGNPFPGLRPFEPHESPLFFGREEQCDDLLARLGRRRLVAVVGMSGSGKSSLVRAGLLPALDRGYLPSAGSSWHIAIFRPGSDPVANLTQGLVTRRQPGASVTDDPGTLRAELEASSLGLVTVARHLLEDTQDSLLIVADQFEELFRFGRLSGDNDGAGSAACVDLLLNAARQEDVPVYVVLTMRSDYLGDCAHFTGLPEALNDSQFLVPRMTRAQLRDAIESPVAVGGARITPRLVQRLLHDIEDIPAVDEPRAARQDQDQLPVLQHALMRMWEVSRDARERGEPIDLPHYERPPVETLRHALDRHAEEVYQALPTERHRQVTRLLFQQLTDRDAENREVRRPTSLADLKAVARPASAATAPADDRVVDDVIAAFGAPGCAFVVVNAQQDVDVSHESFIRRWTRLREWVEQENRSRRVYVRLADAAAAWERGEASLYRGPELTLARRWWDQEAPTQDWANRYDPRFETARRFLLKSVRGRQLRSGLLIGNVLLLLVSAVAIAALMTISSRRARAAEAAALQAEAAALEVRNTTDRYNRQLAEANRLRQEALAAQIQGDSKQAELLARQAQQVQEAQQAGPTLTASELSELDRLRRQEVTWRQTETDLRKQLATTQVAAAATPTAPPPVAPAPDISATDRTDLDRLRRAESDWERDVARLRQQLAAANDRATKLQAEAAARGTDDEVRTTPTPPPPPPAPPDSAGVEQVLRDYQAAYGRRDAAAVAALMPSANAADLTRSFSQLRAYEMEILNPRITVSGDTAVVTCTRRISIEPRVGARPAPRSIPSVFRLRRAGGNWTIESVEEQR